MRQIVYGVANVVELAGTLAGVPYIGPAAALLQNIILSCDEIRTHKVWTALFITLTKSNRCTLAEESTAHTQQVRTTNYVPQ